MILEHKSLELFGKQLFERLTEAGVVVDWREPNVIRMAPVPMYNTFEDIARFVHVLKRSTKKAPQNA